MRVLALPVVVLWLGCGGPSLVIDSYREVQNNNNGLDKKLTFTSVYDIGVAANRMISVGAPFAVVVSRTEGTYRCTTERRHKYTNYSPFPDGAYEVTQCELIEPLSPVARVLEVTCDRPCTATIEGDTAVVVGREKGKTQITVTAEMKDGRRITDRYDLEFWAPDTLTLRCMRGQMCPGPHAIFAGTSFAWKAQIEWSNYTLEGPVEVKVEPAGVVEVTNARYPVGDPSLINVRATNPGAATITLKIATLEWVQPIRVVAVDDVVSGELRVVSDTPTPWSTVMSMKANADPVGTAIPSPMRAASFVAPVWTLKDGSRALGGAKAVTSSTPGIAIKVEASDLPPPYPQYASDLAFQATEPPGCTPAKQISGSAAMGAVRFDWAFVQQCD